MADAVPAAGLLTLTQWLSPAFPLGGFAYSHGLEAAVEAGRVTDAASLQAWVGDVLREGAGRSDAILLAHALSDDGDAVALDRLSRAMAASKERLAETLEQGTALIRTTNALTGADHPAMTLPVALGVASRPLAVDPVQAIALYLQAFAGNMVMAGVRFIPLGQTEGQAVLAALHPAMLSVAAEAAAAPLDALGGAAIGSDLAAMAHETMDTRIFRT
ncbi:urease accessory protein UreF [Acidimangrovimonas sediminis]|uniref:urease accessory protein UreF n=1 Tax=Acidimangrovimonas sediminis TaxID=2056283 RepID=UPI000C80AA38|nr:urease accessory UreF family protein [Acidimangrovimonas sediminis]